MEATTSNFSPTAEQPQEITAAQLQAAVELHKKKLKRMKTDDGREPTSPSVTDEEMPPKPMYMRNCIEPYDYTGDPTANICDPKFLKYTWNDVMELLRKCSERQAFMDTEKGGRPPNSVDLNVLSRSNQIPIALRNKGLHKKTLLFCAREFVKWGVLKWLPKVGKDVYVPVRDYVLVPMAPPALPEGTETQPTEDTKEPMNQENQIFQEMVQKAMHAAILASAAQEIPVPPKPYEVLHRVVRNGSVMWEVFLETNEKKLFSLPMVFQHEKKNEILNGILAYEENVQKPKKRQSTDSLLPTSPDQPKRKRGRPRKSENRIPEPNKQEDEVSTILRDILSIHPVISPDGIVMAQTVVPPMTDVTLVSTPMQAAQTEPVQQQTQPQQEAAQPQPQVQQEEAPKQEANANGN